MNVLILAFGGDTPSGYEYLVNVAKSFVERKHRVVFAVDNKYFIDASFSNLSQFKTYIYDDWVKQQSSINSYSGTQDISESAAYVNFERLKCWNANKSLINYKRSLEHGLIDKYIAYFLEIIEREKIDVIVHETVSSLQAFVAYYAAVEKGIPYIGWIMSRIPGRFDLLSDPYGNIAELRAEYEQVDIKNIEKEELQYINRYLDNIAAVKPDYMNNNPMRMEINYLSQYSKKLGKAARMIPIIMKAQVNDAYYIKYPLELKIAMLKYNLKRQAKISWLKNKFASINPKEKYFLFPMHFQPEASTGVNAPFYCNQAEVIRCIAFSLPRGVKLYVKDHPNGIGFLPIESYKKIFSLPNVKYINPKEDTKMLISNAQGIVTITSTMGYEALLMKKPVITLGKVFFNAHPYCIHVKGYEELYDSMKKVMSSQAPDFDEVNIRFVKAYLNRSYEGKLLDGRKESIDGVVDAILTEVNKIKLRG